MPLNLDTIRQMNAAAAIARDADERYWTDLATGQDTEEAEHSGYLIGRAEAFAEVLRLMEQNGEKS